MCLSLPELMSQSSLYESINFETGLFALFLLTNTCVIENFVHRIIFHMQHISFQTNNVTIGV